MKALELENKSLSAQLDSMVDKLCFCTQVEVTFQVVGSDLSSWRKTDIIPLRSTELSPSLSTPRNLQIIHCTSKLMLSPLYPSKPPRNIQLMFLS